jgi:hypothetical protein
VLIHQIPPNPAYLRAKIGRRLGRIGAIAVKNSVYVMPNHDSAREDFQWIRTEVTAGGGDATILAAELVDGLTDADVIEMFLAARAPDYAEVAAEARALGKRKPAAAERASWEAALVRLESRLAEIAAIDHFDAPAGDAATRLVAELRARLEPPERRRTDMMNPEELRGRVWVTRAGIKVDRIASAWLVRRFVDGTARFKFVPGHDYAPAASEIRFDMKNGELTHEADRCTFEVMLSRLGLDAPGLGAVAEIVHDIDLNEEKYGRPETAGVAAMLSGLVASCGDDELRLERGMVLFDMLLAQMAHRREKS